MQRHTTTLVIFLFLAVCLLPRVAASPSAIIQNDSSFIDETGFFHVVGEVKNTGSDWLDYVRVTASFKDQTGAVLATAFTYTQLRLLPTGVASGFDVEDPDSAGASQVQSYTLSLDYLEALPLTSELEIKNTSSSKNSFGWLQIVGVVSDDGDSISEYTEVTATFYGTDGRVVAVGTTYTDPNTIQPHSQQSFTLTLRSAARSNVTVAWSLDTQSAQYASIPETPLPIILLATALTVTCLTVQKQRRPTADC